MKYAITILMFVCWYNTTSAQIDCPFNIDVDVVSTNKNLNRLLRILKTDSFTISNDKKRIPAIVFKQINCIIPKGEEKFSIANPGERVQIGCSRVQGDTAPERKLLFYAESDRMSVLSYISGTVAVSTTIILIRYAHQRITVDADNRKVIDFWSGTIFDEPNNPSELVKSIEMELSNSDPWLNEEGGIAY